MRVRIAGVLLLLASAGLGVGSLPVPALLSADSFETAFEKLRAPEALAQPARREVLIRQGFGAQPEAAAAYLLNLLWTRPGSDRLEAWRAQETDCHVVRTVLARMPRETQERVARLEVEDPYRKARLLEALGAFQTPAALETLRSALGDRSPAGLERGPVDGWPLRVCDVAYNTLALALALDGRDLRSPLGSSHSLAQRDRWIERMGAWLDAHEGEAAETFAAPGRSPADR